MLEAHHIPKLHSRFFQISQQFFECKQIINYFIENENAFIWGRELKTADNKEDL